MLTILTALEEYGLSKQAAKKLIKTGKYETPFGHLTLDGHILKVKRKATNEVVTYDLQPRV